MLLGKIFILLYTKFFKVLMFYLLLLVVYDIFNSIATAIEVSPCNLMSDDLHLTSIYNDHHHIKSLYNLLRKSTLDFTAQPLYEIKVKYENKKPSNY